VEDHVSQFHGCVGAVWTALFVASCAATPITVDVPPAPEVGEPPPVVDASRAAQVAFWNADRGSLAGIVCGPDGTPIDGALVAIVSMSDAFAESASVLSASGGRFRFILLAPGNYAVTATAPGQAAGYVGGIRLGESKPMTGVRVRLGGEGVVVHGVVHDPAGRPIPGQLLRFARISDLHGDLFLGTTDGNGAYRVALPRAGYSVLAQSDGLEPFEQRTLALDDETLDVSFTSGPQNLVAPPTTRVRRLDSLRPRSAHSLRLDER
jgi:Carboxypeptidase regulatory-like domain